MQSILRPSESGPETWTDLQHNNSYSTAVTLIKKDTEDTKSSPETSLTQLFPSFLFQMSCYRFVYAYVDWFFHDLPRTNIM